jgi:hypothetical protein
MLFGNVAINCEFDNLTVCFLGTFPSERAGHVVRFILIECLLNSLISVNKFLFSNTSIELCVIFYVDT